jgi:hypothetical protein
VRALACIDELGLLLSGDSEDHIRIWDFNNWQLLQRLNLQCSSNALRLILSLSSGTAFAEIADD